MIVKKIENLDDRVRIHCHLLRPYGVKDEFPVVDIIYDNIDTVKTFQGHLENARRFHDYYNIKVKDKNLVIVFERYQENCSGPPWENILGVFIKKEDKLKELELILKEFNSPVSFESIEGPKCPDCNNPLRTNDRVESAGGAAVEYTPLDYCNKCGYYKIGTKVWSSTDY